MAIALYKGIFYSNCCNVSMYKRKVLESSQASVKQSQVKKRRYWKRIISPSTNAPLPKSIVVRMRYVAQFSLNPALGTPTFYQLSANGLYDPDITGGGHQPNGFDQMMALYNHYEVLSSECKFDVFNGLGTVFAMGIKLDDSGTMANNGNETTWEQNLTNWKAITNASDTCTVRMKFNSKSFFGDKSGDRETWGDAAANPNDQAYFLCLLGPNSIGADLGSTTCMAQIDYLVKLHEPKDLIAS